MQDKNKTTFASNSSTTIERVVSSFMSGFCFFSSEVQFHTMQRCSTCATPSSLLYLLKLDQQSHFRLLCGNTHRTRTRVLYLYSAISATKNNPIPAQQRRRRDPQQSKFNFPFGFGKSGSERRDGGKQFQRDASSSVFRLEGCHLPTVG